MQIRSWPFKRLLPFFSTLQAMMVTYGHCWVHLTLGGLSKSWKTTLWPETKCGVEMAWLLGSFSVPLTVAQLVEASGIRNILSLGPGKIFLCGFCGKKKALRTLCVCVCMCVAYYTSNIFKNLRTNQNRFHSRNIICHLWWRLFITFKVEITLHQVFYNSSYFGGLRVGKQIII